MTPEGLSHSPEIKEKRPLEGKVAAITGTSRGIGAEIAKSLAESGANIMGMYNDPQKAKRQKEVETVIEPHGVLFQHSVGDITEANDRETFLNGALWLSEKNPPQIDILILNAAGGLEQGKPDGWAEKINFDAQLELVSKALPNMAPDGKIIYITSLWAHEFDQDPDMLPMYGPIAKTKFAAEEALRDRISQMSELGVSLGIVVGDITKGTAAHTIFTRMYPEKIDEIRKTLPNGDFPTTKDMGNAVRNMLVNGFVSGETVFVGRNKLPERKQEAQTSFDRKEVAEKFLPMYDDSKLYIDSFQIEEKGKKGTAKFTVRPEDCEGHFSEKFDEGNIQLFRGVDQIEAAAQALGLVFLTSQKTEGLGVFAGVSNVEFKGMIFPGQEMELKAELTKDPTLRGIEGKCEIVANGNVVTTIEGLRINILHNMKLARRLINSQRPKNVKTSSIQ